MLLYTQALKHSSIQASDGWAGSLDQFLFDDVTWKIGYIAVCLGRWRTGPGVLLSPSIVRSFSAETNSFAMTETREYIANQSESSTNPSVAGQHQARANEQTTPIPYCGELGLWASHLYTMTLLDMHCEQNEHRDWNPHLQGTRDVSGYAIAARDRTFGRLEGFIVDDRTWRVVYLLIRTGPWHIGRCVALEPRYIRGFDWATQIVTVDVWHADLAQFPQVQTLHNQETGKL